MKYIAFSLLLFGCQQKPNDTPEDTNEPQDTNPEDTGSEDTANGEQPTLEQNFQLQLENHSGCTDTWFYGWNSDDSVSISVYVPNILQQAVDNGPQELTWNIEDGGSAYVTATIADGLSVNFCTDALEDIEIHNTYQAISGTITATAETRAESIHDGGTGGYLLENILLEDTSGNQTTIDTFEIINIEIMGAWGG